MTSNYFSVGELWFKRRAGNVGWTHSWAAWF